MKDINLQVSKNYIFPIISHLIFILILEETKHFSLFIVKFSLLSCIKNYQYF